MTGPVFVTGASGFIGRAVVARYASQGAEVRGVDLAADLERGVVAGRTEEPAEWAAALRGCELVVHTAARVSFVGDEPDFWRVNVLGTRRVLEAAAGAGVQRFVHLSSVTAFGFDFPDGVEESWPVHCNGSPYVDTKVAGEQVVLQAHAAGEIAATVIRPGDVHGPGSRPWTITPVEMLRAGRLVVPMRGRGVHSPVFVENLVDGIVLAASKPAAAGRVITISDGVGVSYADFFGYYARMTGRRLRFVPAAVAHGVAAAAERGARVVGRHTEMNRFSAEYLCRTGTYSIRTARELLGYEPRVGLDEGMAVTEAWLRETGRI